MIDKTALQISQQQWQIIAEFELKEELQSSPLQRWNKLNALIRLAAGLNLAVGASFEEEKVVWERWNKLKNIILSNNHPKL